MNLSVPIKIIIQELIAYYLSRLNKSNGRAFLADRIEEVISAQNCEIVKKAFLSLESTFEKVNQQESSNVNSVVSNTCLQFTKVLVSNPVKCWFRKMKKKIDPYCSAIGCIDLFP